jgi:hypothetical protein
MIDPSDPSRDPSSPDPDRPGRSRNPDRIDMHGRAAQLVANVAVLLADAADAADDAATGATGRPEPVPTRNGTAKVYVDETGADVVIGGTTVHVRTE